MNISRKLGTLVFCGVPAIIGGGVTFAIFDNYIPVLIYEILLLFAAGVFISK
jgi:zinc transporter ZupT